MVVIANQMVSELHHVVVDSAVDNRIVSVPKAKQVAAETARKMNEEFCTDAYRIAFVKRDGSILVK